MGVELPLRVVVTILECCVTFSGVKLSIRSFVLFSRLQGCDSINFVDMRKPLAWLTSALKTRTTALAMHRAMPMKSQKKASKDLVCK